jgi:molybdopterin-guanine dinucleotide biosynthesis protein
VDLAIGQFVAGSTSTGKTTLVNALLAEVAKTGDRVAVSAVTWQPTKSSDSLRLTLS